MRAFGPGCWAGSCGVVAEEALTGAQHRKRDRAPALRLREKPLALRQGRKSKGP